MLGPRGRCCCIVLLQGFGRSLDDFFRGHSQYFDDYQATASARFHLIKLRLSYNCTATEDEHALHYTTLHKDPVDVSERL